MAGLHASLSAPLFTINQFFCSLSSGDSHASVNFQNLPNHITSVESVCWIRSSAIDLLSSLINFLLVLCSLILFAENKGKQVSRTLPTTWPIFSIILVSTRVLVFGSEEDTGKPTAAASIFACVQRSENSRETNSIYRLFDFDYYRLLHQIADQPNSFLCYFFDYGHGQTVTTLHKT